MDFDPYQAPETSIRPMEGAVDVQKVRSRLRLPAIILIVLASIAGLLELVATAIAIHLTMRYVRLGRGDGGFMINAIGNGGLFLLHAIVLYGSVQMTRVRSYNLAMTAAVFSAIPICSPILVLGMPFGIWAIVVLCGQGVRDVFRTNDVQVEVRTGEIKFLD